MVHCTYQGVTGKFPGRIAVFTLVNSVDLDQMPHSAAFHLAWVITFCISIYLSGFQYTGLTILWAPVSHANVRAVEGPLI